MEIKALPIMGRKFSISQESPQGKEIFFELSSPY